MKEILLNLQKIVISDYGKKNDLIKFIEEKLKKLSTPQNIIDIIIGKLNDDDENIYKKYLQNLPNLTEEERQLLEKNLQILLKNIKKSIDYRSSYFII